MKLTLALGIGGAVVLVATGSAQLCRTSPELRPAAQNLGFDAGAPGMPLPGWWLDPESWLPAARGAYAAEITTSRNTSKQCASVRSVRADPSAPLAFLDQVIEAAAHRNTRLTLRAAARVAPGSVARLLVRVHRMDCSTSFFDNLGDHPITTPSWSFYEIQAPIARDAHDIEFGVQLIGQGAVWIDNVSMNFVEDGR